MIFMLKAIVGWLILMLVGTILTKSVVRGIFWSPPDLEVGPDDLPEPIAREFRRLRHVNFALTTFSMLAAIGYLAILVYYWNWLLAVAAGMIMLSCIPDVLWEIRTGQKLTRSNAPRALVYYCFTALDWLAFPVIWYSLYIGSS